MKAFFLALLLLFQSYLKAEIYDCFTFFNELELLKVRLAELDDVVDHFVIVESPISYTGKSKPLYYKENEEEFKKYQHKIIHLVIDFFPDLTGDEKHDHWKREEYSRNFFMKALTRCQRDDIIFISDLDEIPRATSVLEIKDYLSSFKNQRIAKIKKVKKKGGEKQIIKAPETSILSKKNENKFVCSLEMRFFTYQLNLENMRGWQGGSKAVPYWFMQRHTPWEVKIYHHANKDLHSVVNAGWHFNTMGGKDKALYKWQLTGPLYDFHEMLNALENDDELLEKTYRGHILGNPCVAVPIDHSFPKYIVDNLEYFKNLGWVEPVKDGEP